MTHPGYVLGGRYHPPTVTHRAQWLHHGWLLCHSAKKNRSWCCAEGLRVRDRAEVGWKPGRPGGQLLRLMKLNKVPQGWLHENFNEEPWPGQMLHTNALARSGAGTRTDARLSVTLAAPSLHQGEWISKTHVDHPFVSHHGDCVVYVATTPPERGLPISSSSSADL